MFHRFKPKSHFIKSFKHHHTPFMMKMEFWSRIVWLQISLHLQPILIVYLRSQTGRGVELLMKYNCQYRLSLSTQPIRTGEHSWTRTGIMQRQSWHIAAPLVANANSRLWASLAVLHPSFMTITAYCWFSAYDFLPVVHYDESVLPASADSVLILRHCPYFLPNCSSWVITRPQLQLLNHRSYG